MLHKLTFFDVGEFRLVTIEVRGELHLEPGIIDTEHNTYFPLGPVTVDSFKIFEND
jgi:hypothetical protein